MQYLMVSIFSLVGWFIALGVFSWAKNLPRIMFIVVHYAVDLVVFGLAFYVYFKFFGKLSPFSAMATAMASLFAVEFILWKFFFPGQTAYLNFVDWIIPAFIIASVIYWVGTLR